MKIVVIQPAMVGEVQKKKIIEFKLNMNQFSVVDKVDFFKQTNELKCSNLISTTVSKDKVVRDFKKLEGKLSRLRKRLCKLRGQNWRKRSLKSIKERAMKPRTR